MAMFRTRTGRAMARSKKRPTGQKLPRRKLPRGVRLRGGYQPPGMLPGGVKPAQSAMPLTPAKIADIAVGKAIPMAPPSVQKAASAAVQAAGSALTARAVKAVETKISGGSAAPQPPRTPDNIRANDPVISSASIGMSTAPRNNAMVPDKKISISVTNGFYTAREKKFYTRWPVQKVQIYQSLIHNRMRHVVAPGHKSFWYPFANTISAPPISTVHLYRKGVELTVSGDNAVSVPPPFAPSNLNYGTVMGGQDYTYPLHLGGYADYCSVLSALTDDTFPNRAERSLQANNSLKFGTVSNHLTFDIENQNKYYPADFTIQVHEVIQPGNLDNYPVRDPVAVMFNDTSGIPEFARGFESTSTTYVPNLIPLEEVIYTETKSLLANAPTIANLTLFKRLFRTVETHKVSLTAGSRLSVELTQHVGAFDVFDYLSNPTANLTNAASNKGQLFVTIMCKGNKECSGDVYQDGAFIWHADFQSNPCAYSVMNINKFARVHAPQIIEKTDDTTGYENVNEDYVQFTDNMFAFGEQRQSSFVPVGYYDRPYGQVADTPSASGTSVVFPVLTNQTESAAGQR